MKKTSFLMLLLALCSFKSFAWKYVVKQCEIVQVTNNCCFRLWVTIDKVDDNGAFLDHVCHGYVYTGCCSALPPRDRKSENSSCGDEMYEGDHFYAGNDSQCMVPVISQPAVFKDYTDAKNIALQKWKAAQE